MDAEAGSAATEATPSGPPPPPRPRAPEDDAAVSSAEAAGGPKGGGEEGSAKPGADAVVLDLGKVPLPPEPEGEEERREGDLGAAADRGQGECASVVVDIKGESAKGSSGDWGGGSWDAEKECRICHVSPDMREGSELIQLGCGCKNELGIAHRHCAEAWFKLRGNRCCEICGVTAKNITGIEDGNFLEEWNERTSNGTGNRNASESGRCWRGQPLCNFLLACLVIAFILPWFFRVNMF